ncbi:MAG: VWA domain-containing protein [Bacteroidota bacterium]
MFRFEYSMHLYALVAIPILLGLFLWMWYARKRAIEKFGDWALMEQLMPQVSKYKHSLKFGLLIFAVATLIVAWANPQWGTKKEKVKRKSADVFIALDVSYSMMAQDIRPSRLERAKQFAQKLVKELKGERVGTIIFAGNAYLQMPLTTDYSAAQLFLKSANPDMVPTQGTAIGEAVWMAEQSFEEDNKHHKAMVIITDGEDHEPETIEEVQRARDNGLLIFAVGVGTNEGGFIPYQVNGRWDYKRDKTGNPVRSKLNETTLGEIAEKAGGSYFNLSEGDKIIGALQEKIDKVEKRELEQRSFSEYESYFQYFIALALLLLLIEFFISYRKSRLLQGKDFFGT